MGGKIPTIGGLKMVNLICFVIGILSFIVSGFALVDMWEWFIVPLGVAAIGFWHACGISLLARCLTFDITLTRNTGETAEEQASRRLEHCIAGLMFALIVWGFGWCYQYMAFAGG